MIYNGIHGEYSSWLVCLWTTALFKQTCNAYEEYNFQHETHRDNKKFKIVPDLTNKMEIAWLRSEVYRKQGNEDYERS